MLNFRLIRWELGSEKFPKTFFIVLERQNLQIETISGLYTVNNKSKYSSNPKDIFKYAKNIYKKLNNKEITSKVPTTKFLGKIPNKENI